MFNHIQFLRNSIVELCSMDLQKSSSKALVSLQQLAKVLQLALQTKKKVHKEYALSFTTSCSKCVVYALSVLRIEYILRNF